MKQLLLEITPPPSAAFDNFVTGSNRELVGALHEFAAGSLTERVVYVWGAQGAGKSHLLAATLGAATMPAFTVSADVPQSPAQPTLILLDNVTRLDEPRQIALFNLINTLGSNALLVTGPCAPRDLPLRRDLATRLGHGLVYQVHALTDAEKMAALASHAATRGFALTEEVAGYLLRHGRRDMPSLVGMLDALDRYSLEVGRPITIPLLKEALHGQ